MAQRTPLFDTAMIALHYEHLDRFWAQDRFELAGLFSEKNGGAYLFRADNSKRPA